MKGTNCCNDKLVHILESKGETKNLNGTIVKYILYLLAHKGSRFDCYVVLVSLPQGRTVVNLIKTASGIVSLKIFTGYVDKDKEVRQYVLFRCGLLHIKDSLKKIGRISELQPCLLKLELTHDEIFEDTWEEKENK